MLSAAARLERFSRLCPLMLLSGHSPAPGSSTTPPQPLDSTRSVRADPPRSGSRGSPPAASSTGQQCAGSMAKWIKEHLGFKSSKPPPPAPPKPDYRQCQAGGHHHCAVPQLPVTPAGQPDILAAYKLQKDRDFEDPYTTSNATGSPLHSSVVPTAPPAPTAQSPSSPSPTPEVKYVSPKHRLIKVDTGEKGGSSPSNPGQSAPKSPPASVAPQLDDCKQEKPIILEDYADPFDAKQGPGSQTTAEIVTENDGYMEPYEAQKMMAEIRRRGSKDLPCKPLHLYDTPYEPSENGLESGGEKSSGQRPPRESRLPQDDERPPEEYDQPWEWKKDRISKAFAVGQLNSTAETQESDVSSSFSSQQPPSSPHVTSQNSIEDSNAQLDHDDDDDKTGMSPSREDKLRHMHRHSAGNLKAIKNSSVEHISTVGERIDPSLPLESQLNTIIEMIIQFAVICTVVFYRHNAIKALIPTAIPKSGIWNLQEHGLNGAEGCAYSTSVLFIFCSTAVNSGVLYSAFSSSSIDHKGISSRLYISSSFKLGLQIPDFGVLRSVS
ncbi:SH2 domain-containing adapter protein F isoform X3 [Dendrobates tinctorius]|uniref:SH2 domain-containing adapter protein F isoform X3 n=1 Tax=Dendrobates tinctorius TaxID=92724 RepID=UPI003CC9773B